MMRSQCRADLVERMRVAVIIRNNQFIEVFFIIQFQYIRRMSQNGDLPPAKQLEIHNQKIQNMIQTLLHVFNEVNFDTQSIISSVKKEEEPTDKLSILIRKTAVLLFEAESLKKQTPKNSRKQCSPVIPKSPRRGLEQGEAQNDEIFCKLLESMKDLFEIYNILVKVFKENNKNVVYKCFDEFQNTFKCIQTSIAAYKSNSDSINKIINQISKEKFLSHNLYSQLSVSNTPSLNNPSQNICQPSISANINPLTFGENRSQLNGVNGRLSEKSTIIIEDLKEEISLLNHALHNNDRNYEFQIQKYQQKLVDLGQTIRELKEILWENQRVYQNQTEALQTQIYEYKLLVRNMARKIRNLETSGSFGESSWEVEKTKQYLKSDRERPHRLRGQRVESRNYMCPRLSRQRQGMDSRERSIKRSINIAGLRRSISRENNHLLRNSNSSSRNKLV